MKQNPSSTRLDWFYGLIFIPVVFAFLALKYQVFFFKAGVAGLGIFIIGFLIWFSIL